MKRAQPDFDAYCDAVATAPLSVTGLRDLRRSGASWWTTRWRRCRSVGASLPCRGGRCRQRQWLSRHPAGALVRRPGHSARVGCAQGVVSARAVRGGGAGLRGGAGTVGAGRPGDGRDRYDLALARALAQPPVAAELCLPLVRPGGRVILWTGRPPLAELERVAPALGGRLGRVEAVAEGRWLVELDKLEPTPERFPRRAGMARKRPLASLPSTA